MHDWSRLARENCRLPALRTRARRSDLKLRITDLKYATGDRGFSWKEAIAPSFMKEEADNSGRHESQVASWHQFSLVIKLRAESRRVESFRKRARRNSAESGK